MSSITQCRSCSGTQLLPIMSLGHTPLANSLLRADQLSEPEPVYPLDLVFCPGCSLVQITETVPPEQLFRNYFYLSSFSETMLQSSKALAERLIRERGLGSEQLVVEIASNDGYLLKNYVDHDISVLGIEPAQNIAPLARQRGVNTISEFFTTELAQKLVEDGIKADVIHANNVLAHVADLNNVVAGISVLLKQDGIAVVEVPYVRDMVDHREFDTIYHEHLCYFSLTALDQLFRRHKLFLTNVERLSLHGGSLRLFITRNNAPSTAVVSLLHEEHQLQLDQIRYYVEFSEKIAQLRDELRSTLRRLKADGKTIAVYGASAKGSTLLHYFDIGRELLDFVVDRSTVKQGHYTPGTHLPIYAPEKLLEAMPDYTLLLTWNFADEILSQQEEYRKRGGQFIVPIPEVRIV